MYRFGYFYLASYNLPNYYKIILICLQNIKIKTIGHNYKMHKNVPIIVGHTPLRVVFFLILNTAVIHPNPKRCLTREVKI